MYGVCGRRWQCGQTWPGSATVLCAQAEAVRSELARQCHCVVCDRRGSAVWAGPAVPLCCVWQAVAVRSELARQWQLLEAGGEVRNETRRYDPALRTTHAMRDKETLQVSARHEGQGDPAGKCTPWGTRRSCRSVHAWGTRKPCRSVHAMRDKETLQVSARHGGQGDPAGQCTPWGTRRPCRSVHAETANSSVSLVLLN